MIAPARLAAFDALRLIDDEDLDPGAAIARVRDRLTDERDRALTLELVTGTLRMRGAIDYQLAQRVKRPLAKLDAAVLRVLRLGGFQLLYLTKVPVSAVINDAVELTRRAGKSSASGLSNAVLRGLVRERETLQWPSRDSLPLHLSIVHSHPQWLVERWLSRYDAEATEAWLRFNNEPASMCLAVNRHHSDRDALAAELTAAGVVTHPGTRAAQALIVENGRPMRTPAFEQGRFVIQDEASQLIGELAAEYSRGRVLDLCASPGGKTLALSAAGRTTSVVACDVRAARVRLLQRTLTRCRVPNATVVHIPEHGALPFASDTFDTVLIDAPCSGLGTVRRDPDIKWKRSPDDLHRFAATQLALLDRVSGLLRARGTIVYATCSSEPEENEAVVGAFLERQPEFRQVRVHRTLPFQDGLEAFFAAVLERSA